MPTARDECMVLGRPESEHEMKLSILTRVSEKKKLWWFQFFENRFGPATPDNPLIDENVPLIDGPEPDSGVAALGGYPTAEWDQDKDAARKSLRTASWAMMFFIVSRIELLDSADAAQITTDVIGPTNVLHLLGPMTPVDKFTVTIRFLHIGFRGRCLAL